MDYCNYNNEAQMVMCVMSMTLMTYDEVWMGIMTYDDVLMAVMSIYNVWMVIM